MNLIFELSKEHATLPTAEVLACLYSEDADFSIIESSADVLVINTEIDKTSVQTIAGRLSLTFSVNELLFSSQPSIQAVQHHAEQHPINELGSIAIQYKNRSTSINSQPLLKTLGDLYTTDRTVDLTNPDIRLRALITNSTIYVGPQLVEINRRQYEQRKVQHRPFFSPISLHPKWARTMVNLSLIKSGDTLLDPFCGTGGILLEAGLLGAKVIGSDIQERMIAGCKQTLDHFHVQHHQLHCGDIGDIDNQISNVDAVVTDFPYGKATTTKGEHLQTLYSRSFQKIHTVLNKGKRAIIGLSTENMIPLGESYFTLVEKHELKVHRSLTRSFAVFKK